MKRILVVLAVGAGLLGLAWVVGWIGDGVESAKWLGLQRVDDDFPSYRLVHLTWTVDRAGVATSGTHEAYLKVAETSDRVGFCGYLLMRHGGQSQVAAEWLADARLRLAGHVFRAGFVNAAPPGFTPADAQAGCVITDVPWRAEFAAAPVMFYGPPLLQGR